MALLPRKRLADVLEAVDGTRTKLIEDVLNAVDGTYAHATTSVHNLVEHGVELTSDEVGAIMASFLMESSNSRCIRTYGEGCGHNFLKFFGAKVPSCEYNQLHSTSLSKYFYDHYINGKNQELNQTLYGLFCDFFNLNGDIAWLSAEAAVAFFAAQKDDNIQMLKERIGNKRLVVMSGVGVSLGIVNDSRLSWEGLLGGIRTILNNRRSDIIPDAKWVGRPEEKAQQLDKIVKANFAHLDYRQFVSLIMREIVSPNDAPLASAISNLGLPIATTNYDLILDQCLHRFEKNLSDNTIRFSAQNHHEFIYHLHGVWFDSNSVVLSNGEYERTQYDFEYAIGKLFFDSAKPTQHRSLLFVGSKGGIVDAHFSTLYKDPRFAHLSHFALLRTKDVNELMDNPEFYGAVTTKKLIPVIFGDDYASLPNFLGSLV